MLVAYSVNTSGSSSTCGVISPGRAPRDPYSNGSIIINIQLATVDTNDITAIYTVYTYKCSIVYIVHTAV